MNELTPIKYPLSKGLLVSMAMRARHDFGQTFQEHGILRSGTTMEERRALIRRMIDLYHHFDRDGDPRDVKERQVREEITGEGFFRLSSEQAYAMDFPEGAEFCDLEEGKPLQPGDECQPQEGAAWFVVTAERVAAGRNAGKKYRRRIL